jgi:hypothetical protein
VRLLDDGTLETVKRGVLDYRRSPPAALCTTNGKFVIACDREGKETVSER